jgi:hypothetical protein
MLTVASSRTDSEANCHKNRSLTTTELIVFPKFILVVFHLVPVQLRKNSRQLCIIISVFLVNTFELCGRKQGYQATGFQGQAYGFVWLFFLWEPQDSQPTNWRFLVFIILYRTIHALHIATIKPCSQLQENDHRPIYIGYNFSQCCGSGSGIGCFLTPGSGIRNRFFPDPGSQDHIFKSFLTIFLVKSSIILWKLAQIFPSALQS